jgi:hypothetical protein
MTFRLALRFLTEPLRFGDWAGRFLAAMTLPLRFFLAITVILLG